jgi:hypothetical protein
MWFGGEPVQPPALAPAGPSRDEPLPDLQTQLKDQEIHLASGDGGSEATALEKIHFQKTINATKRNPDKTCHDCGFEGKRNMGKSVWMGEAAGSSDRQDGHWEWNCYQCWGKWEGKARIHMSG